MRPILGLMIMGEHNEAINNQCAFRHSLGGGIAMEVLGCVVIARKFCHVKSGASTQPPPPHSSSQSQAHALRPF